MLAQAAGEQGLGDLLIMLVAGVAGFALHVWTRLKRLADAEVAEHETLVDGFVIGKEGGTDGGSQLVVLHPTPSGELGEFTSRWVTRGETVGTRVPVAIDASGEGRIVLPKVSPWRAWWFPVVMWTTWFGLGGWRLITML